MDGWRPMEVPPKSELAIRLEIGNESEVPAALWDDPVYVDPNTDLTKPRGRWVIMGTMDDAVPSGKGRLDGSQSNEARPYSFPAGREGERVDQSCFDGVERLSGRSCKYFPRSLP